MGQDDEKMPKLNDLLNKQEPLNEDLVPYLSNIPSLGWPVLKHPLVFSVPYVETLNAYLNQYYKQKKEASEEALNVKNYTKYVFLHERPHRIEAFDDIRSDLNDHDYWTLVSAIWIDTENAYQNHEMWKEIWDSDRPGRDVVMEDDEKKFLDSLPGEFTIYRGFAHDGAEQGLSWTIDNEKAKWFALRLAKESDKPRVASVTVKKSQIIAFLAGRGEKEIIVDPDNFTNLVKVKTLRRKK